MTRRKAVPVLIVALFILAIVVEIPVVRSIANPALDGTPQVNGCTNVTTCALSAITLSNTKDVIVVQESVTTAARLATPTVTCSPSCAGLTFTAFRAAVGYERDYWAYWTGSGTVTITCNASSGTGPTCVGSAISNLYTSGSAPVVDQYCTTTSAATCTIPTTSYVDDYVLGFGAAWTDSTDGPPTISSALSNPYVTTVGRSASAACTSTSLCVIEETVSALGATQTTYAETFTMTTADARDVIGEALESLAGAGSYIVAVSVTNTYTQALTTPGGISGVTLTDTRTFTADLLQATVLSNHNSCYDQSGSGCTVTITILAKSTVIVEQMCSTSCAAATFSSALTTGLTQRKSITWNSGSDYLIEYFGYASSQISNDVLVARIRELLHLGHVD